MTIDATISEVLDTLKPAGARWVVWVDDDGFRSCYGPFDEYKGAQDWMAKHTPAGDVEVLPLYDRS
jgi:hypothetical protein